MLTKPSIVLEDLPAGQLGEARRNEDLSHFYTVIDMEEHRNLASQTGAPLVQAVSDTVLHEFVHHEHWTWGEDSVADEGDRRFMAMFGIPSPNTAGYDAAKHAKIPTC